MISDMDIQEDSQLLNMLCDTVDGSSEFEPRFSTDQSLKLSIRREPSF